MAKILMIDDDQKLLALYSQILRIEGFKVLTATEGKRGIEIATSEIPDLILLDVMMPEVDGTKVFETLAENSKTAKIPVVFLTSLVREDEVEAKGGNIGGRKYLSKATPRDKFVIKVKEFLAGK